jgi:hypothetical protein
MDREVLNRVKRFFGIILIIFGIIGAFGIFNSPYIVTANLVGANLLGFLTGAWLVAGLFIYGGYRLCKSAKK